MWKPVAGGTARVAFDILVGSRTKLVVRGPRNWVAPADEFQRPESCHLSGVEPILVDPAQWRKVKRQLAKGDQWSGLSRIHSGCSSTGREYQHTRPSLPSLQAARPATSERDNYLVYIYLLFPLSRPGLHSSSSYSQHPFAPPTPPVISRDHAHGNSLRATHRYRCGHSCNIFPFTDPPGVAFVFLAVLVWRVLVGVDDIRHAPATTTHHHTAHPVDVVAAQHHISDIQQATIVWMDYWPIRPSRELLVAALIRLQSLRGPTTPPFPTQNTHAPEL